MHTARHTGTRDPPVSPGTPPRTESCVRDRRALGWNRAQSHRKATDPALLRLPRLQATCLHRLLPALRRLQRESPNGNSDLTVPTKLSILLWLPSAPGRKLGHEPGGTQVVSPQHQCWRPD
ncbi:hypothetical protein HJG60_008131 [Phyllostomus discolor]|uniref:Uncharacterized protein n=1 Tax=Phyllostomus discolor TaxID=89673 RepID=A0A833Z697_9CHIR|nr:hypothetical protein HJG60_008131 [Phyllostomus discolor]